MSAGLKTRTARVQALALQQAHLLRELKTLRKTFREMVDAYAFHVEGRIEALAKCLVGESLQDTFFKKTSQQILQDLGFMVGQVRAVNITPKRARRKDLKKIEKMIDSFLWILELDKNVARAETRP